MTNCRIDGRSRLVPLFVDLVASFLPPQQHDPHPLHRAGHTHHGHATAPPHVLAAHAVAPALTILDHQRAIALLSPEAVWALPAPLRSAAWLASRGRFDADLAWALRAYDADTAAAAAPLNLRQQPIPPLPPGAATPPLASRPLHAVAAELGASLAGHADLLRVACAAIGRRFLASRAPKWCSLRAELGAAVAAAGAAAADPLAQLIAEADRAVCASAAVAGAAAGPARAAAASSAEGHWASLLRASFGLARVPALAGADPAAVAAAIRRATKEAWQAAVAARTSPLPSTRLRAEFAAPVAETYPALAPAYLAKVRAHARARGGPHALSTPARSSPRSPAPWTCAPCLRRPSRAPTGRTCLPCAQTHSSSSTTRAHSTAPRASTHPLRSSQPPQRTPSRTSSDGSARASSRPQAARAPQRSLRTSTTWAARGRLHSPSVALQASRGTPLTRCRWARGGRGGVLLRGVQDVRAPPLLLLLLQVAMVLADPHVSRAAVACSLRALVPAALSGVAVALPPQLERAPPGAVQPAPPAQAVSALAVLALGDAAFAGPAASPASSQQPQQPQPDAGALAAVAAALSELLAKARDAPAATVAAAAPLHPGPGRKPGKPAAAGADAAAAAIPPPPVPLPLHLVATCRCLQNLLLEQRLQQLAPTPPTPADGGGADDDVAFGLGPADPARDGAPAAAAGTAASATPAYLTPRLGSLALGALTALPRSPAAPQRASALLCVAFATQALPLAGSAGAPPQRAVVLRALQLICAQLLACPGGSAADAAALSTLVVALVPVMRAAAAGAAAAGEQQGQGQQPGATISPAQIAQAVFDRCLLPVVAAASGVGGSGGGSGGTPWLRALVHADAARFLLFCANNGYVAVLPPPLPPGIGPQATAAAAAAASPALAWFKRLLETLAGGTGSDGRGGAFARTLESADAAVTAAGGGSSSCTAAPHAALARAGLLTPAALVWARDDMGAARRVYASVAAALAMGPGPAAGGGGGGGGRAGGAAATGPGSGGGGSTALSPGATPLGGGGGGGATPGGATPGGGSTPGGSSVGSGRTRGSGLGGRVVNDAWRSAGLGPAAVALAAAAPAAAFASLPTGTPPASGGPGGSPMLLGGRPVGSPSGLAAGTAAGVLSGGGTPTGLGPPGAVATAAVAPQPAPAGALPLPGRTGPFGGMVPFAAPPQAHAAAAGAMSDAE